MAYPPLPRPESQLVVATFDVWETLIKDNHELSDRRAQLRAARMADVLRRHGYAVDIPRVRQIYDQSLDRLEHDVWSKYLDVSTRQQLVVFLSVLDPHMAPPADEGMLMALEEAYTTPIFDLPPLLASGAEWVLDTVRQMGLRLGLICNTGVTPGKDMRSLLDGYGVLQHFEVLAFSDEEAIRKPRQEIFLKVVDLLGVTPDQAVHIGDDAVADIAGARGAGMKAIMVRSTLPSRLPIPPDLRVDNLLGVPEAIQQLRQLTS